MTLLQRFKSYVLAWLQYGLGWCLFVSGIAAWHKRLHIYAMMQLQRASHKHHNKAQQLMGKLLTYRGETIIDRRAGMALLQQQADSGDAQAQFLLAEALLNPQLVVDAEQEQQAVKWYLLAAKQDHAMAALRLSKAYAQGALGLEKSEEQAQYWSSQFMRHSKMSSDL